MAPSPLGMVPSKGSAPGGCHSSDASISSPGYCNYTSFNSSLGEEGREKKKKPFVLRFGGELLESELKDKDSILLHNNKGLMDKISKNYELIKFRAVLGGEMKGKMRPFEKRRRAV